ncbi:MAG: hypothetical protein R3F30_02795 [Planctomycetota bacterium]
MRPMTLALSAVLTSGILFVPTMPAQDQDTGKTTTRADEDRIQELVDKLGAPDFAVRRKAAAELEGMGLSARKALEKCASDSDDPEQRWQARRILRRLDGGGAKLERMEGKDDAQDGPTSGGLRPWTPHRGGDIQVQGRGTRIQIGPDGVEVEVETQDEGKKDVKRFKAKDLETLLKEHPELKGKVGTFEMPGFGQGFRIGPRGFDFRFGPGMPGGEQFEQEMDRFRQEMERFQDQMRGWSQGARKDGTWVLPPMRPFDVDRVPAKGLEQEIGRLQQRIAELQARLEAERAKVGKDAVGKDAEAKAHEHEAQGGGLTPVEQPRKLGIYVGEGDTAAVGRFLGLPEGVGLWVQGTVEGSLAQKLGLAEGDLLVKLGDHWLKSAADVAAALADLDEGQEVVAVFWRKGEEKQAKARFTQGS